MAEKRTVAVLGASGYTGAELLRLLAAHPYFEVVAVTASSNEGAAVADLYPALAAAYPGLRFGPTQAAAAEGADLVFCALPHGASQKLVPELLRRAGPCRGPGRRFPPEGPGALPDLVRRRAHLPGAAGRRRVRPA